MDYLALKRPWVGVLVFFCIAMVPSESGDSSVANVADTQMRMVQVTKGKGNILQNLVEKAMENANNSKMIKEKKGLKIRALSEPHTSLNLEPKDKRSTKVRMNITVAGKSFIGGNMAITMVADLQNCAQISVSPNGKVILKVTLCIVKVISYKTNLPSRLKIRALSEPHTSLNLEPKDKLSTSVWINITVAGKRFRRTRS